MNPFSRQAQAKAIAKTKEAITERAPKLKHPPIHHQPSNDAVFVPMPIMDALWQEIPAKDRVLSNRANQIKDIQKRFSDAKAFLDATIKSRTKSGFVAIHVELKNDIHAGNVESIKNFDMPSREEYRRQAYEKSHAAKKAVRAIIAELPPFKLEQAEQLSPVAARLAVEQEAAEMAMAERWGLPYQPSEVIRILDFIARRPDFVAERILPNSPGDLLELAKK